MRTGSGRAMPCASRRRSCCRSRCSGSGPSGGPRPRPRGRPVRSRGELDGSLPFELTGDQREVGSVIADELAAGAPMNRLVQGEVGSGKTLVALRAMLDGRRLGRAVGVPRADRGARGSASALAGRDARTRPLGQAARDSADRPAVRGRAAQGSVGRGIRWCPDRRGHARAALGEGAVRRPGARRRRRAAPLRGRPARGAAAEGAGAARARADGDADSAHRRDDRVRRPRHLDDRRAAEGARADHLARGGAGRASGVGVADLGAARGGARAGPAGLRRLSGDRRRRTVEDDTEISGCGRRSLPTPRRPLR